MDLIASIDAIEYATKLLVLQKSNLAPNEQGKFVKDMTIIAARFAIWMDTSAYTIINYQSRSLFAYNDWLKLSPLPRQ